MLTCIKTILGKDLQLNPYEEYFTVKPNPSEQDSLNKLNRLLSLALPLINSGQEPDVQALANEVGVDEETARELLSNSIKKIKTLQRRRQKKKTIRVVTPRPSYFVTEIADPFIISPIISPLNTNS